MIYIDKTFKLGPIEFTFYRNHVSKYTSVRLNVGGFHVGYTKRSCR